MSLRPPPFAASPRPRSSRRRSRSRRRPSTCRPNAAALRPPPRHRRRRRRARLPPRTPPGQRRTATSAPFDVRNRPRATPMPGPRRVIPTSRSTSPIARPRRAAAEPAAPGGAEGPRLESSRIDRYLLSGANLMFEGETGRRRWGFYLTAEQAAQPAALAIAFNSAIYVSPEDSLLDIKINDRQVVEPGAARPREPDLYRRADPARHAPGRASTSSRFQVDQRHRTDCTMLSTYDLWTEFESGGTGIVFEGADPTRLASLEELPAVGVDATGRTRIELVAPGAERAFADSDLARLVQAIVLRGNFRQAVVSVDRRQRRRAAAGRAPLWWERRTSSRRRGPAAGGRPTRRRSASSMRRARPRRWSSPGRAWQDVKSAIGLHRQRRRPAARIPCAAPSTRRR